MNCLDVFELKSSKSERKTMEILFPGAKIVFIGAFQELRVGILYPSVWMRDVGVMK